jgi:class 3 adenylate cyclase/pimeloyl-ACP methyl ester carboxylesterase
VQVARHKAGPVGANAQVTPGSNFGALAGSIPVRLRHCFCRRHRGRWVYRDTVRVQVDVRYARSSGAAIAYQVVGTGPVDLVFVPDYMSNLVFGWEWPRWREFYLRLARFSRLILFDKRGTGLSDYTGAFPTLETRMEDLRAVLDAAGSDRTSLLAAQEGCAMAALFAATYPERTKALVLFQPSVAGDPDHPEWGVRGTAETREQGLAELAALRDGWGTQEYCDEMLTQIAPSLASDPEERTWFANWLRCGATPAAAYALNRMYIETDLRDVLPAVRVPTLLLSRGDGADASTKLVADRLPSSQTVRLPGEDFWGLFLSDEVPDEVERFLAGNSAEADDADRVLTTLMFTDLVESTRRLAVGGDAEWRDVLTRHHVVIRQELRRHRGREVDTSGDGFFATFDGPARAIRCAADIRARISELGLDVRVGIHTGECELVDDKPVGVAVHTAARVMGSGGAGDIVVTAAVKDLVAGSGIVFDDRGEAALKGIPEPTHLYVVTSV